MRSPCQLIFLTAALIGPCATTAMGQDAEVITSFEDLSAYMGLVDRDKRVDVAVAVNFWDPASSMLFVQKGSLGCFVDISQIWPRAAEKFALGDRIKIQGHFDGSRDCLVANSITFLEHGPPIEALDLDIDRLAPRANWSDRVSLSGTVEQFVQVDEGVVLTVRGQVQHFLVRIAHDQQADRLAQLVGSRVSVTGCLDWVADEYGVRNTAICLLMSGSDVVGLPLPSTTAAHKLKLKEIRHRSSLGGQTVETVGIVSHVINRELLLLESLESGGVLVRSPDVHSLDVGDVVQLIGDLNFSNGQPTIVAQSLRKQMTHLPIPPTRTSATDVIASNLALTRVSMSADLTALSSRGKMRTLKLTDNGIDFTARIVLDDAEFDSLNLPRAKRVRVEGALLKPGSPEETFVVHGRGVKAVTVTETWMKFDRTRVRFLTGTLTCCLLMGGAMIWLLRSQVRKKTQALTDMTAQLSSAFDAVQEGLLVLDRSGAVLSWNDRMSRLFDLDSNIAQGPELVSHLASKLAEPDEFLSLWNSLPASSKETFVSTLKTYDEGSYTAYSSPIFSGEDKQQVVGRLWAFEDVSKRSQLEAKLAQSQKMEAIGRLAGGIAHDFNNLLMGISANLELMRSGDADDQGPSLTAAEKATDRAARLVERLLSFSRQSPVRLVPMNPNNIVRSVSELASQKLSEQVSFELADDESVWLVDVDEVQLEQVLLNLCLNASDSLADQPGTITVSTENIVDDTLGECVRLSVIDSGMGMPETVTAKIFEPFFTTKDIDKGTGLGLAMSYGIVNQHNGRIDVESKVGFGSRFDIVLPRSQHLTAAVIQPVPEEQTIAAREDASAANKHILIADDEEFIRVAAARMLTLAGYTVSTACNGLEVLEQLTRDSRIDMLVLDLTMPALSGRETLQRVSERYPQLPVLLCTGHLMDSDLSMLSAHNLVDVITKPFRAQTLLKSVELGLHGPLGAPEQSSLESA